MEVVILHNEVLRGSGTTDDDRLDVFEVRKPIIAGVFCGTLEEIMGCFFDQSLEPLSGLTTLTVFSHDVGYKVFLDMDALPRCDAKGCFTAVNDKQAIRFLIDQHVFKLS